MPSWLEICHPAAPINHLEESIRYIKIWAEQDGEKGVATPEGLFVLQPLFPDSFFKMDPVEPPVAPVTPPPEPIYTDDDLFGPDSMDDYGGGDGEA